MTDQKTKQIVIFFCGIAGFCFLVIGIFIYPNAEIMLYVPHEPLALNFEFDVVTSTDVTIFELKKIPGRVVLGNFSGEDLNKFTLERYIILPELISDEFQGDQKRALLFKEDDVRALADFWRDKEKQDGKSFLFDEDMVFEYSVLSYEPDIPKGVLMVHLENVVVPELDEQGLKEAVLGITKEEAEEILIENEEITGVNIVISPPWFPHVPFIRERVNLKISIQDKEM